MHCARVHIGAKRRRPTIIQVANPAHRPAIENCPKDVQIIPVALEEPIEVDR